MASSNISNESKLSNEIMIPDNKESNAVLREFTISRLLKAGAPIDDVIDVLRKLYIADKEDFDEKFIESEVYQYQELHLPGGSPGKRSIRNEVKDWLTSNTSNNPLYQNFTCSLQACYLDLGLKTPSERASCRMAFKRLVELGKLEPLQNRSGMYRYIDGRMEDLDFINADTTPFDIKFPFNVHEWVSLYRKSLVVIAGEPNAGKTAYLLNVAKKNMVEHKINYFSSEMGAAELKVRLIEFDIPLQHWEKVRFVAKSRDFKDVIDPNGFNIIDYLEVKKDFYEVGGILTDIFETLDKGVAVVGIQKPMGRDTGIGGERTLDKARLYMAIEPGKLKIVKGKIWRQRSINPSGLWVKWTLTGGAQFHTMPDSNTGDVWRRP